MAKKKKKSRKMMDQEGEVRDDDGGGLRSREGLHHLKTAQGPSIDASLSTVVEGNFEDSVAPTETVPQTSRPENLDSVGIVAPTEVNKNDGITNADSRTFGTKMITPQYNTATFDDNLDTWSSGSKDRKSRKRRASEPYNPGWNTPSIDPFAGPSKSPHGKKENSSFEAVSGLNIGLAQVLESSEPQNTRSAQSDAEADAEKNDPEADKHNTNLYSRGRIGTARYNTTSNPSGEIEGSIIGGGVPSSELSDDSDRHVAQQSDDSSDISDQHFGSGSGSLLSEFFSSQYSEGHHNSDSQAPNNPTHLDNAGFYQPYPYHNPYPAQYPLWYPPAYRYPPQSSSRPPRMSQPPQSANRAHSRRRSIAAGFEGSQSRQSSPSVTRRPKLEQHFKARETTSRTRTNKRTDHDVERKAEKSRSRQPKFPRTTPGNSLYSSEGLKLGNAKTTSRSIDKNASRGEASALTLMPVPPPWATYYPSPYAPKPFADILAPGAPNAPTPVGLASPVTAPSASAVQDASQRTTSSQPPSIDVTTKVPRGANFKDTSNTQLVISVPVQCSHATLHSRFSTLLHRNWPERTSLGDQGETCVHKVVNAKRFKKRDGSHSIELFSDSGPSPGEQNEPYQIQWLHMQRRHMDLADFENMCLNAPNISGELRFVVLRLFKKVQDTCRKRLFDGFFIDPGTVLRCDGFSSRGTNNFDLSATFVCFPYLSMGERRNEDCSQTSEYPTRSILQIFYPYESTSNQETAASFCKDASTKKNVLYVPQLWVVFIGSSTGSTLSSLFGQMLINLKSMSSHVLSLRAKMC
ncbi:hypothetical protein IQ07DRAFT_318209 [Pyrenochaeta sp. DS3sAY3a]|nr:hypothetical protein IQ07DRAFT_318209 [Pyrenochaeta sp. DS3sAY3a]